MSYVTAFILGLVIFLGLATGLGLLTLGMFGRLAGRGFKFTRRSFLYTLAIPVVLGAVALLAGGFLAWHETPGFCGDICHSMEPLYETYEDPGNNSLMTAHVGDDVTCTGCHVGPGWKGQVGSFLNVPWETVSEAFNLYEPGDLDGEVPAGWCLKCHDGDIAAKPGNVTTAIGTLANPHDDDEGEGEDGEDEDGEDDDEEGDEDECASCHTPHMPGTGLSFRTCSICHGTVMPDFRSSLRAHAERVNASCLSCHDRAHPEDAEVPFVEAAGTASEDFCSDCHGPEVAAYDGSATEGSRELYGECVDCHGSHDSVPPPHPAAPDYGNCTSCHGPLALPGGIHNRTSVSYLGVDDVGNELCAPCHADQVEGLADEEDHEDLDCVACHSEHLRLRVDFTACDDCHEDIPGGHNVNTARCNRNDCHEGDFDYH